ncbi:Apelin receptor B [Platysternon megacephalum]|uniref:Apelin receptor B n=1 Tax=Platysternon megacephalum TaxID=55544 RepID=A0A4D9DRD4_9SAUR|nr:Apelin receptor B [Platysternon megacephalum]
MEDAAADPLGGKPYCYYGEANESGPGAQREWPADWEVSFSLLPVLYMLVFVLGLSGNGLVLFTVWAKGRSADTYIGNLPLADLAFMVTLPQWAAYTALRFHWPFGSALCKLPSYLVLLNMFASTFCLGCLSFERYLAIVRLCAAAPLCCSRCPRSACWPCPPCCYATGSPARPTTGMPPLEMCRPRHVLALLVLEPVLPLCQIINLILVTA